MMTMATMRSAKSICGKQTREPNERRWLANKGRLRREDLTKKLWKYISIIPCTEGWALVSAEWKVNRCLFKTFEICLFGCLYSAVIQKVLFPKSFAKNNRKKPRVMWATHGFCPPKHKWEMCLDFSGNLYVFMFFFCRCHNHGVEMWGFSPRSSETFPFVIKK